MLDNSNWEISHDSGSFRDPCGQVFKITKDKESQIIRGIDLITFNDQKELINTNFFKSRVSQNEIIQTTIFNQSAISPINLIDNWPYYLEHQALPLISYPYEWTFSQLKDAAILHLNLMQDALQNGWIIKDATPYNIQFFKNQPIFIDTPSFIKWEDGSGWDSYRQFCMMFLYPLMLKSYLDIDFRPIMRSNLDGINPEFMYKILGARHLFKKGIISHVYLPYLMQRNILQKERDTALAKNRSQISHSKISVIALVDSMLRLIKNLKNKMDISAWADYDHKNTYQEDDNEIKKSFIQNVVKNKNFYTAWDMGANTGLFSEHISEYVKNVLAMDADSIAIEKMYQRLKFKESNIHPLVMNLENVSPNQGFNSQERSRLESRSNPDLVMCLAIIHHVRLNSNIPCETFLNYLRSLNAEIVIEFVDREDEMVVKLLMNKKEQYADYNIDSFKESTLKFFNIQDTTSVKGGLRTLFHLTPK